MKNAHLSLASGSLILLLHLLLSYSSSPDITLSKTGDSILLNSEQIQSATHYSNSRVLSDCDDTFIQVVGSSQNGEGLSTILLASDGFLYVAGSRGNEGLLIKMDTDGTIISEQIFGFTNRQDRILSIMEDDDHIIGVGFGQSTSSNGRTGFIFKYSILTESIIWVNRFSERTGFWAVNINPANDNYLAVGAWSMTDQNAVIAEFDRNTGSLNWTNAIDVGNAEAYYDVIPVGNTLFLPNRYTLYDDLGNMRAGITALNLQGDHQWSKYYLHSPTQLARQYSFGMTEDNGGLTVAYTGAPNGVALSAFKGGLIRTDYSGNIEWVTEYNAQNINTELIYGIESTSDGYLLYGYAIIGGVEDLLIIKTDKDGNALWCRTYGTNQDDDIIFNASNQILQSDGYIYTVGRTRYYNNSEDGIIIKANAEDGSINDDCIYSQSHEISTTFISNPLEVTENVNQFNTSDVLNEVSSPQGSELSLSNEMLCQASSADLTAIIEELSCNDGIYSLDISICNADSNIFPSGGIYTIYNGNPLIDPDATILTTSTVPVMLPPGWCYTENIVIPTPGNNIFIVANDDASMPPPFDLSTDFPVTTIAECEYTNNVDSINFEASVLVIDLGSDTGICDGDVLLLDAGSTFSSYLWQDGSTEQSYSVSESGVYWVSATTLCGDVVEDTINVAVLDTTLTILEFTTCHDTPYVYEGVELAPGSTNTFPFIAENGCDSTIVVTIIELDPIQTYELRQACEGESVQVSGEEVFESGLFLDTLVSLQGCDSVHTIEVLIESPELSIPNGALSCVTFLGELSATVTGGTPPYDIIWSNGQTGSTIINLEVGTYTASVTDDFGCMSEATATVFEDFPLPELDLSIFDISCYGAVDGAIVINDIIGIAPPFEYSLDGTNYQTTNLFQSLLPGVYTLFIRNSEQCESTLSVIIAEPLPLTLMLPNDTTIYLGESLTIDPIIQSSLPLTYEWSPETYLSCQDCPNPIAMPFASTTYTLTLRDTNACTISQQLNININERSRIYIPNAFSPNGDGRNDIFTLFVGPEVERVLSFQVYNRWGGQVYRQEDFIPNGFNTGWDGTLKGEPLGAGVYAYFVEALLINGSSVVLKGDLHLVR